MKPHNRSMLLPLPACMALSLVVSAASFSCRVGSLNDYLRSKPWGLKQRFYLILAFFIRFGKQMVI